MKKIYVLLFSVLLCIGVFFNNSNNKDNQIYADEAITVHYVLNGIGDDKTQSYTPLGLNGYCIGYAPTDPNNTKVFIGWCSDQECTNVISRFDGSGVSKNEIISYGFDLTNNEITIYAKWEEGVTVSGKLICTNYDLYDLENANLRFRAGSPTSASQFSTNCDATGSYSICLPKNKEYFVDFASSYNYQGIFYVQKIFNVKEDDLQNINIYFSKIKYEVTIGLKTSTLTTNVLLNSIENDSESDIIFHDSVDGSDITVNPSSGSSHLFEKLYFVDSIDGNTINVTSVVSLGEYLTQGQMIKKGTLIEVHSLSDEIRIFNYYDNSYNNVCYGGDFFRADRDYVIAEVSANSSGDHTIKLKPIFEFTNENQSFDTSSSLDLTFSSTLDGNSLYYRVYIDGNEIGLYNYEIINSPGYLNDGVIFKLKKEYLSTLTTGEHNISISNDAVFNSCVAATTTFTVTNTSLPAIEGDNFLVINNNSQKLYMINDQLYGNPIDGLSVYVDESYYVIKITSDEVTLNSIDEDCIYYKGKSLKIIPDTNNATLNINIGISPFDYTNGITEVNAIKALSNVSLYINKEIETIPKPTIEININDTYTSDSRRYDTRCPLINGINVESIETHAVTIKENLYGYAIKGSYNCIFNRTNLYINYLNLDYNESGDTIPSAIYLSDGSFKAYYSHIDIDTSYEGFGGQEAFDAPSAIVVPSFGAYQNSQIILKGEKLTTSSNSSYAIKIGPNSADISESELRFSDYDYGIYSDNSTSSIYFKDSNIRGKAKKTLLSANKLVFDYQSPLQGSFEIEKSEPIDTTSPIISLVNNGTIVTTQLDDNYALYFQDNDSYYNEFNINNIDSYKSARIAVKQVVPQYPEDYDLRINVYSNSKLFYKDGELIYTFSDDYEPPFTIEYDSTTKNYLITFEDHTGNLILESTNEPIIESKNGCSITITSKLASYFNFKLNINAFEEGERKEYFAIISDGYLYFNDSGCTEENKRLNFNFTDSTQYSSITEEDTNIIKPYVSFAKASSDIILTNTTFQSSNYGSLFYCTNNFVASSCDIKHNVLSVNDYVDDNLINDIHAKNISFSKSNSSNATNSFFTNTYIETNYDETNNYTALDVASFILVPFDCVSFEATNSSKFELYGNSFSTNNSNICINASESIQINDFSDIKFINFCIGLQSKEIYITDSAIEISSYYSCLNATDKIEYNMANANLDEYKFRLHLYKDNSVTTDLGIINVANQAYSDSSSYYNFVFDNSYLLKGYRENDTSFTRYETFNEDNRKKYSHVAIIPYDYDFPDQSPFSVKDNAAFYICDDNFPKLVYEKVNDTYSIKENYSYQDLEGVLEWDFDEDSKTFTITTTGDVKLESKNIPCIGSNDGEIKVVIIGKADTEGNNSLTLETSDETPSNYKIIDCAENNLTIKSESLSLNDPAFKLNFKDLTYDQDYRVDAELDDPYDVGGIRCLTLNADHVDFNLELSGDGIDVVPHTNNETAIIFNNCNYTYHLYDIVPTTADTEFFYTGIISSGKIIIKADDINYSNYNLYITDKNNQPITSNSINYFVGLQTDGEIYFENTKYSFNGNPNIEGTMAICCTSQKPMTFKNCVFDIQNIYAGILSFYSISLTDCYTDIISKYCAIGALGPIDITYTDTNIDPDTHHLNLIQTSQYSTFYTPPGDTGLSVPISCILSLTPQNQNMSKFKSIFNIDFGNQSYTILACTTSPNNEQSEYEFNEVDLSENKDVTIEAQNLGANPPAYMGYRQVKVGLKNNVEPALEDCKFFLSYYENNEFKTYKIYDDAGEEKTYGDLPNHVTVSHNEINSNIFDVYVDGSGANVVQLFALDTPVICTNSINGVNYGFNLIGKGKINTRLKLSENLETYPESLSFFKSASSLNVYLDNTYDEFKIDFSDQLGQDKFSNTGFRTVVNCFEANGDISLSNIERLFGQIYGQIAKSNNGSISITNCPTIMIYFIDTAHETGNNKISLYTFIAKDDITIKNSNIDAYQNNTFITDSKVKYGFAKSTNNNIILEGAGIYFKGNENESSTSNPTFAISANNKISIKEYINEDSSTINSDLHLFNISGGIRNYSSENNIEILNSSIEMKSLYSGIYTPGTLNLTVSSLDNHNIDIKILYPDVISIPLASGDSIHLDSAIVASNFEKNLPEGVALHGKFGSDTYNDDGSYEEYIGDEIYGTTPDANYKHILLGDAPHEPGLNEYDLKIIDTVDGVTSKKYYNGSADRLEEIWSSGSSLDWLVSSGDNSTIHYNNDTNTFTIDINEVQSLNSIDEAVITTKHEKSVSIIGDSTLTLNLDHNEENGYTGPIYMIDSAYCVNLGDNNNDLKVVFNDLYFSDSNKLSLQQNVATHNLIYADNDINIKNTNISSTNYGFLFYTSSGSVNINNSEITHDIYNLYNFQNDDTNKIFTINSGAYININNSSLTSSIKNIDANDYSYLNYAGIQSNLTEIIGDNNNAISIVNSDINLTGNKYNDNHINYAIDTVDHNIYIEHSKINIQDVIDGISTFGENASVTIKDCNSFNIDSFGSCISADKLNIEISNTDSINEFKLHSNKMDNSKIIDSGFNDNFTINIIDNDLPYTLKFSIDDIIYEEYDQNNLDSYKYAKFICSLEPELFINLSDTNVLAYNGNNYISGESNDIEVSYDSSNNKYIIHMIGDVDTTLNENSYFIKIDDSNSDNPKSLYIDGDYKLYAIINNTDNTKEYNAINIKGDLTIQNTKFKVSLNYPYQTTHGLTYGIKANSLNLNKGSIELNNFYEGCRINNNIDIANSSYKSSTYNSGLNTLNSNSKINIKEDDNVTHVFNVSSNNNPAISISNLDNLTFTLPNNRLIKGSTVAYENDNHVQVDAKNNISYNKTDNNHYREVYLEYKQAPHNPSSGGSSYTPPKTGIE